MPDRREVRSEVVLAAGIAEPARLTVWTIGHSNHTGERLVEILQTHRIAAVADVRTSPYSSYSKQFNKDQLARLLEANGIRYVFLGGELGGRPSDPELYDAGGHVRYDLVSESPSFLQGIERVERGAAEYRIALLCGEDDPISCHRRRLVGRVLTARGIEVEHIRGDGSTTSEADIERREVTEFPERFQLSLDGPPPWRSEHPVRTREVGGDQWTES
jgi:uncharacterized protein (DUF488 family)